MTTESHIAMQSKGILYAATGIKYVEEAAVSAMSAKQAMPGVKIHLFTDIEKVPEVFDGTSCIRDPRLNCYDKVLPMLNSPFEQTLFLDTDTYLCEDVSELFTMLGRFDMLACHIPIRGCNPIMGIPDSFPELNTGVLAFRRNDKTIAFFEKWLEYYEELGFKADQPAFRKALWVDHSISAYQLPVEYNLRTIAPNFIAHGAKVKIIHGRHRNWHALERRLNRHTGGRAMLLSPLDRWSKKVVVARSWLDLIKSFIKRFL
jgi:hypothetical protein